MKALLKSLTLIIIFVVFVGLGFSVYVLQAPPVEQKGAPKLQIHTRTALRSRPTVNSKTDSLHQRCIPFQCGSAIY